MTFKDYQKSSYTLVIGLGITGMSVVRHLSALNESLMVVDTRDIPPCLAEFNQQFKDIPLTTGKFNADLFLNARRIVVSPGISLSIPEIKLAIDHGIEVIGDIDLFTHEVDAPIVAITGSNGKSTVTTLVSLMAEKSGIKVATGGNIGTPVLDLLAQESELYVLELSSFQLETAHHLAITAAVVLNISADHMDRYDDLQSYALSKQVIYENSKTHIVNRDDELSAPKRNNNQQIGFTLGDPDGLDFGVSEYGGEKWLCRGDKNIINISELKIKGQHNISNALASLALGSSLNFPVACMLDALKEFSGLPHRMQWVAEKDGVQWINDSKATNTGATYAAIKGLPGKHVLIAGGEGKGADFSELQTVINEKLRAAILIGRDARLIAKHIEKNIPVEYAEDMSQAVDLARKYALKGDNVLLSPACASFDMYRDFEHRGNEYIKSVKELLT